MDELVLVGFMAIEDHAEDYSNWSGHIAYPNPEGANLAWEKPIKMIQYSAYENLKSEIERYKVTVERLENQLMTYEERGWLDE